MEKIQGKVIVKNGHWSKILNSFLIVAVLPDFAQVYGFIGSVFDPNTIGHVQRLKKMDPIDVETVCSHFNFIIFIHLEPETYFTLHQSNSALHLSGVVANEKPLYQLDQSWFCGARKCSSTYLLYFIAHTTYVTHIFTVNTILNLIIGIIDRRFLLKLLWINSL